MEHIVWLESVSVSKRLKFCPFRGVDNSLLSKTAICSRHWQLAVCQLATLIRSPNGLL